MPPEPHSPYTQPYAEAQAGAESQVGSQAEPEQRSATAQSGPGAPGADEPDAPAGPASGENPDDTATQVFRAPDDPR